MKIIFYDVEHGSCCHIITPKQKHILIDVGSKSYKSIVEHIKRNYFYYGGTIDEFIITMRFDKGVEESHKQFVQTGNRMLTGEETPPFRFYDLKINPVHFSEMEITVSPQLSPGNRVLLETLVGKYNPTAKIVESQYLGLI